jgi:RND family efflux transporter MFP subunit
MSQKTTSNRLPVAAAAAVLAAALSVLPARGADDAAADRAIEPAISRPSEERKIAFAAPGLISDVAVKEGDAVKAGQVLAQQDDAEEQVALRSLQLDADSMAEIDYEKKDEEDKQVIYDRKLQLFNDEGHAASQSEVDEARLGVELAKAQILVAEEKHSKAVLDAQRQKIKVEHMQVKSPVDGVVQTINTRAGEMADPQSKDGVMVVVKNDPLWVEIHPAADRALKLQMGQELQVRYAAPFGVEPLPWQSARVIYFAPKADAGSKTELVRLELPNPAGQRSGLSMEVRLPANVAAVATGSPAAPSDGPELPPVSN